MNHIRFFEIMDRVRSSIESKGLFAGIKILREIFPEVGPLEARDIINKHFPDALNYYTQSFKLKQ